MREAEEAHRGSCTAAVGAAAIGAAAIGDSYAKGIVYCRSRQLYNEIATVVGYSSYHAGVGSRTAILEQWRQDGRLIMYTSALRVGVDIAGIAFTLHVEQL
jgi:superfamily II DNA helicase RecQ